jgi:DNA polymerase I-like protein with 3'-5' exonuclease and polymerase domains
LFRPTLDHISYLNKVPLGAVPVIVCHDEMVIECGSEKAAYAKSWLENAMIEGMDTIVNGTDEEHVPVEVEARIARSWGEGPSGSSPRDIF